MHKVLSALLTTSFIKLCRKWKKIWHVAGCIFITPGSESQLRGQLPACVFYLGVEVELMCTTSSQIIAAKR